MFIKKEQRQGYLNAKSEWDCTYMYEFQTDTPLKEFITKQDIIKIFYDLAKDKGHVDSCLQDIVIGDDSIEFAWYFPLDNHEINDVDIKVTELIRSKLFPKEVYGSD